VNYLDKYEPVIGLEIHAQMSTQSKAYVADDAGYGAAPNTLISPVTLGLPGTLPKANKQVINYAIKMGLALNCTINKHNEYARKNYFYADLPKGYQITQDTTPICIKGTLTIVVNDNEKQIGITRIHMEEDAGKSIHDIDPYNSLIDLNRAGVALIEIVSEPDLRSADEAYSFVTEIRQIVRYLGICDGNMEEGSLRCDANISVRPRGQKEFNNRVEVKNLNSISNVKKAIEHEIARHIEVMESGGVINQETRNYNALTGTTSMLRSKENAHDYRYFPEPDLPPFVLTDEFVSGIKSEMPELPKALKARYIKDFGLSDYDASIITSDKLAAEYYNKLVALTSNYKGAANWMNGPVRSHLNEQAISLTEFNLLPETLAALIALVDTNKVSYSSAAQKIFPVLVNDVNLQPLAVAENLKLIQESGADFLEEIVEKALAKFPDKVEEYKNGKKGLLGLFMGEVMKLSSGKADPKKANEILRKYLEK